MKNKKCKCCWGTVIAVLVALLYPLGERWFGQGGGWALSFVFAGIAWRLWDQNMLTSSGVVEAAERLAADGAVVAPLDEAALMAALKQQRPHIEFVGIGGPKMQGEGLVSLYPQEALAVRGYAEVIRSLPRLLKIRSGLIDAAETLKGIDEIRILELSSDDVVRHPNARIRQQLAQALADALKQYRAGQGLQGAAGALTNGHHTHHRRNTNDDAEHGK